MHGQFNWYELTTPDTAAAQKFYPRFTGWGTQAFDKDYTMWTSGGAPVGGLFRLTDEMRQQGVPPNWMPYVEATDVDATAAKATSLGGRVVHGPADIPGAGRFAVIQDPQGATLGVYKSQTSSMGAWDGTPVVGRFSWHELMTTDYRAAFEFYRALFGWEQNGEMDMGGGEMYSMFGRGDQMYGGMFNRSGDMQSMPPFWLVYINVEDVGKAVKIATKAGATVHRPQMDIPGGSIAILGDPQGAGFALHHVTPEPVAAKPAAKTGAKKAIRTAARRGKKAARKLGTKVAKTATKVAKAVKKAATRVTKKATKKTAPARTRLKAAGKSARKSAGKAARKVARKSKPKARAGARAKSTSAKRASATRSRARRGSARTARAKKR